MRVLWVATKPAWPAIDGGRALMAATLDALAAAGVSLTFVAPAGRRSSARLLGSLGSAARRGGAALAAAVRDTHTSRRPGATSPAEAINRTDDVGSPDTTDRTASPDRTDSAGSGTVSPGPTEAATLRRPDSTHAVDSADFAGSSSMRRSPTESAMPRRPGSTHAIDSTDSRAGGAGTEAAGVRVRLVEARPRAWLHAAWRSHGSGRPIGIERHATHATAHVVAELVRRERFDVVFVEQLQAWTNAAPAIHAGVAAVLRAQNVESDLWRSAAASASRGAAFFRAEARRLGRFEAETLAAADATIALCSRDAARLSASSPSARVVVVPPPVSAHWQPTETAGHAADLAALAALAALGDRAALADRDIAVDTPSGRNDAGPPSAREGGGLSSKRQTDRRSSAPHHGGPSSERDVDSPPSERRADGPPSRRDHSDDDDDDGGDRGAIRRHARATSPLAGEPAFTWIGSAGWLPNDDGVRWLVREIWPAIAQRVTGAHLHIFGGVAGRGRGRSAALAPAAVGRDASAATPASPASHVSSASSARGESTITRHAAPIDSGAAFVAGTVLLLPMRTAVGVRLRLLEAWARGVPVIASPAAVDGLDAIDGENVLIAADAHGFAEAAARLASEPELRARLVRGGRATIARHHDPATIAHAMIAVFRDAIAHRHGRSTLADVGGTDDAAPRHAGEHD